MGPLPPRTGKRRAWPSVAALALTALGAGACSRSGLGLDESGGGGPTTRLVEDGGPALVTAARDAAASGAPGAPSAMAPDAQVPPDVDAGNPSPPGTAPPPVTKPPVEVPPPPPPKVPHCTPTTETCNGKDDDCNGQVDDGVPPIPCAGGGEQYCVAGGFSACPQRCETCLPGSERVCFLSYCTYWATQKCAADGRSFGTCRERHVPAECASTSSQYKESPELEQCCIDHGYCCHDDYDLDHDGNTDEMLGSCDEVSCHP